MQRIQRSVLTILISVIFFQCQKELSFTGNLPHATSGLVLAPVQGNIQDENGQPVMDATIRVGTQWTQTNARGYFRIPQAFLDRSAALVSVEKQGYFKAFRSFCPTPGTNQVVIKLIKKSLAGSLSAAAGGEVHLSNGTKISLPANGLVGSSGSAYTGTVNIYASYIDPTSIDIDRTVPGSFMADDQNDKRVALASYGMAAVELESASGEKLQVKPGATANLDLPIPSTLLSSAPATISLWHIDEQTGIWKEEGRATKNGSSYVGEVKHFSFWNCDIGIPAVMLSIKIADGEGNPLTHVDVRLKSTKAGQTCGWTDSLGVVRGLVPANEALRLDVLDLCNNVVYTKNIDPLRENTDLGSISINNNSSELVAIKGKLVNCSGRPVTNGVALIDVDNIVRHIATDANGNFTSSFLRCTSSSVAAQILGEDKFTQQQGSVINIPLSTPVTDAGILTACGTSTVEYINYNLDDTLHMLSPGDSILAYPADSIVVFSSGKVYITGYHYPDGSIDFSFNAKGPGTYPVENLSVQDYFYGTNVLVRPFNVLLTNFPQTIGGFYEGSFKGQFTTSNVTHTISCSFKVRRTF